MNEISSWLAKKEEKNCQAIFRALLKLVKNNLGAIGMVNTF